MIKTRLASAAAASLFGLAALVGTVVTVAAPRGGAKGIRTPDLLDANETNSAHRRV
jgi:hypothetical protein